MILCLFYAQLYLYIISTKRPSLIAITHVLQNARELKSFGDFRPIIIIIISFHLAPLTRLSPAGMTAEDEWYNKSLSALRMNSGHHANLAAAPMLQYQT